MNTRLLTPDGFPRADLDVAQSMSYLQGWKEAIDNLPVRTTRARIIYLKNDHKALMSVIEKHIHEHFARLAESGGNTEEPATNGGSSNGRTQQPVPQELSPAFAKVNSVVAGSPADSAGLKVGDEIRNFGYVNLGNHDGLKRVAECVQGNEGVS